MPYVRRGVGSRRASTVPAHASTSASTSPRLWPASAISASECVRSPNADLGDDERDVEPDADGERAVEARGRVERARACRAHGVCPCE